MSVDTIVKTTLPDQKGFCKYTETLEEALAWATRFLRRREVGVLANWNELSQQAKMTLLSDHGGYQITFNIKQQQRLLIIDEKHGKRYFYVPQDEQLFKAALRIVKERFNEDCYYCDPGNAPDQPDVLEGTITTLPASLRPAAEQSWKRWRSAYSEWQDALRDYLQAKKAVDENNGLAAWGLLIGRCDAEYEGAELEICEPLEDEQCRG